MSFAFVSIALGIKWVGEAIIDYRMSKLGMMMSQLNPEQFKAMMQEEEKDDDTFG